MYFRIRSLWLWTTHTHLIGLLTPFDLFGGLLRMPRMSNCYLQTPRILRMFFTEKSRSKAIFTIKRKHVSLHFQVENFHLCHICVIWAILVEITQKLTRFLLKIVSNGENCRSMISRFTQMERIEITFTLKSQKFGHHLSLNVYYISITFPCVSLIIRGTHPLSRLSELSY